MASVNVNPEDVITSVDEEGRGPVESELDVQYPGSVNRSYDEGDEDENLLEGDEHEKDDRTLVACLAPSDRSVCHSLRQCV
jgi:hypothetical protein